MRKESCEEIPNQAINRRLYIKQQYKMLIWSVEIHIHIKHNKVHNNNFL